MREVLILVSGTGILFREWFYMVNGFFLILFPYKKSDCGFGPI
jgi:hypothetical protein